MIVFLKTLLLLLCVNEIHLNFSVHIFPKICIVILILTTQEMYAYNSEASFVLWTPCLKNKISLIISERRYTDEKKSVSDTRNTYSFPLHSFFKTFFRSNKYLAIYIRNTCRNECRSWCKVTVILCDSNINFYIRQISV